MNLTIINSLEELVKFLPSLVKVFKQLDGVWEKDLSTEQFVVMLMDKFGDDTVYYGELKDGVLNYFIAVSYQKNNSAWFWLFYVDKNYRFNTNTLLELLRVDLKSSGVTSMLFSTSRMTKSYDKWVKKFGAEKHLITYKLKI